MKSELIFGYDFLYPKIESKLFNKIYVYLLGMTMGFS